MTDDREPEGGFAPQLDVTDLDASLHFWCGALGFRISYARPEDGFAYLEREGAQVMLCRRNGDWETAPPEHPFGRGLDLQIAVAALDPLLERLRAAGWPLFRAAHYRLGDGAVHLRQFLVQDPDGHLLRFSERLPPQP